MPEFCYITSCLMLSFHSISFLSLLAFCTCYFHLLTRYIFSSRAIYFISSGLSFCPRLVRELLSFIRALVRKRGHIVAHNVPRAAQTGKRFLRTQNVSEQNQKHLFVSRTKKKSFRTNVSRANGETFVSATMCPQQCALVCQGLYSGWSKNALP